MALAQPVVAGRLTAWWAAELRRIDAGSPRLAGALRALERRSVALAVVASCLWGAAAAPMFGVASDADVLLAASRRGPWLDVFADPIVQVGPVHLGLVALLAGVGNLLHVAEPAAVGGGLALLVALGTAAVTRAAGAVRARQLAAVLTVLLAGPLVVTTVAGHQEDLLVALLLLGAAIVAGRRSPGLAAAVGSGALVGMAGGFKLWGVLGVACLLLHADRRRLLAAAGAAVGVLLLLYGPFLLWGEVRTFEFAWSVRDFSPLSFVVDEGTAFGWPLRVLQAALAVGVAAFVARYRRSWWAVPAAVISVRLLTDPATFTYYGATPALVVACVAWAVAPTAGAAAARVVPFCLVATYVGYAVNGPVAAALSAALYGGLAWVACRRAPSAVPAAA